MNQNRINETPLKDDQDARVCATLNAINLSDLIFILDHAAEFFTIAENTTWALRALRYKEFFSKKQQNEPNT